ncbi:chemotaxis protein CheC [Conexibacter sp. SYSU D00693]|uniref:chemotaxis protein CheC n=1 Tax=Conexibacter sp. SYSU D00693 TaxID=2812560 RepID=UPI00196B1157|nr:chemotaxis protein CheC [Conexibacter sp. SYSU D00693]
MTTFTDVQLDALRELANIGSGTAGGALSQMLGKPVDINVPTVQALPVPDAVEAAGDPAEARYGVVVPTVGDLPGHVLLLFPEADAARLCELLGVPVGTDDGRSALGEIGNILGTSYINALAQMLGLDTEPAPPMVVFDMLGAILASVLLGDGTDTTALLMDSALLVEGDSCELSFLLLPAGGAVGDLLARLGL